MNEKTLEFLLDNIDECVFMLEGTTIVYENKLSREYFGESVGSNVFDFLIFEKSTVLVDAIHSKKSNSFEAKIFLNKKGGWHDFLVKYLAHINTLILKDLTFLKNVEEAKINMSVLISHELKNPLGVIESLLSELIENEEDEEKLDKLWKIQRQTKRLNRIIQQIEYITMAQLGLYIPRNETVNVQKLVSEVLEDVEHIRQKKNIKINLNIAEKTLEADMFIIRTILKNLVSNALKYSFENSQIIVEIDKEKIIVQDFGIGVPNSEKEKVFSRFYRSQTAVKMASGSGLGLAVVKHLSNIAGYKIDFESQHLIGTKVTVWIKKE
ncbi:MAG: HAMP domain-containing histidine kinase [Fervidobacterium sp.]|nr:HAMP domain-containing histidine kinase [Fervidobacterium sp.]